MATSNNNNQQKYPYIYQPQQQTQTQRSNPMAAILAQQAMMGNNDFLWGSLAGNWLGQYLSKLLANLANGKRKPTDKTPEEVAPTVFADTGGLMAGAGGMYPTYNDDFERMKNDPLGTLYQTPYEKAQNTPQKWINPGVYDDDEINRYYQQQGYPPFITR